ncbi:MAG: hypothetical protein A2X49_03690 [Lentisphaerae bacterium GWF2_52_8]|nr:MAG: hypothetical protein A2X49_03690 [Lentisphaerae bacterium GWF2_52_8]
MHPVMKMFGMITKSLFGKRVCKMYPFVMPKYFSGTRGHIEIDSSKCILCTLCAKKCPADAIVVERKDKFWQIDRFRCIACNACVDACPKKCLTMNKQYTFADTTKAKSVLKVNVEPPPPPKKEAPPVAPATETAPSSPSA